ncbi:MAG: hypothetical protein IJL50_05350 [Bacteroidaceae bacterium]|nr:hypothetical protein [Bacteroidaceae bacterium]
MSGRSRDTQRERTEQRETSMLAQRCPSRDGRRQSQRRYGRMQWKSNQAVAWGCAQYLVNRLSEERKA